MSRSLTLLALLAGASLATAETPSVLKCQMSSPPFIGNRVPREQVHRQVCEMTTGAAAVTQSLALHRLRDSRTRDDSERNVAIKEVPGIRVPEYPWQQMMGNKKPEREPLPVCCDGWGGVIPAFDT